MAAATADTSNGVDVEVNDLKANIFKVKAATKDLIARAKIIHQTRAEAPKESSQLKGLPALLAQPNLIQQAIHHTHIHTRTQAFPNTHIHLHTHTYTDAQTHTYTHTLTHAHTLHLSNNFYHNTADPPPGCAYFASPSMIYHNTVAPRGARLYFAFW